MIDKNEVNTNSIKDEHKFSLHELIDSYKALNLDLIYNEKGKIKGFMSDMEIMDQILVIKESKENKYDNKK